MKNLLIGLSVAAVIAAAWFVGAESSVTNCGGIPCMQGYQVPMFEVLFISIAFALGMLFAAGE